MSFNPTIEYMYEIFWFSVLAFVFVFAVWVAMTKFLPLREPPRRKRDAPTDDAWLAGDE